MEHTNTTGDQLRRRWEVTFMRLCSLEFQLQTPKCPLYATHDHHSSEVRTRVAGTERRSSQMHSTKLLRKHILVHPRARSTNASHHGIVGVVQGYAHTNLTCTCEAYRGKAAPCEA